MMESENLPEKIRDRIDNPEHPWNQLTFDHDAIIEASAGTGKTYALQSIVLKLLLQKDYEITDILLVTFTEKAAGELKDRIRKILEEADRLPSNFDEATICTIHSFCKDLLAEYAFENRVPMRPTIAVNDDELRLDAVRAALKGRKFRERYGRNGDFGNWMAAAGYESAEKLIDDVSEKLKKRLCKNESAFGETTIDNVRAALRAALRRLDVSTSQDLVDRVNAGVPLNHIHGTDNKSHIIARSQLEQRCDAFLSNNADNFEKAALLWTIWRNEHPSSAALNPRTSAGKEKKGGEQFKGKRLADFIDGWPELIDALDGVAGCFKEELVRGLTEMAAEEYVEAKKLSSVMTFDDMVLDASRVVRNERAKEEKGARSALLDAIRRKFRVALVDEFQDTDARQWEIFHSIFSHEVNNDPKLKDKKSAPLRPGFLLVVGDPKQAIYSFRGADLKVYKEARDAIKKKSENCLKTLGETWRSTPELVKAFNSMFSSADWFGEVYGDGVKFPEGKIDSGDFTGREAVTLLESLPEEAVDANGGLGNNANCLPLFLGNVVQEIRRLMALDAAWTDKNSETDEFSSRRAQYGDFCILVRGKKDAETAKKILGRNGIPYGYYKEAGIYDSAEAEAALALFDFLAEPWRDGNLAALLLTPFFDVPPRELANAVESKPKTMVKLVEEWQLLTAKRKWNELFEDVLAKSALSRPRENDFEYDRRWAAIRQIFDKLLAEIGRTATDIEEFAELLRVWRRDDSKAGDGGALRRKESDANRVQIMTMHASKGLEFPVVFVAYGFASIDYSRNKMTEDEKEENRQETRRLLYVALTRAKRHLYLPWSRRAETRDTDKQTTYGIGSAYSALRHVYKKAEKDRKPSDRNGFLASAICRYFGSVENAANATIDLRGESFGIQKEDKPENDKSGEHEPVALALPKDLARQRKHWDSYSSLRTVSNKPRRSIEKQLDKEEDEDHSLPGGKNAGLAFHKVMELLCGNDGADGQHPDFGTVGNAKSANELFDEEKNAPLWALVRKAMKDNSLKPGEGNSTAEKKLICMAWQALNKEFVFKKSSFRLKDVPGNDRRAEVEFAVDEAKSLDVTESNRDGAFNGSVDLLVRLKGVGGPYYYFLDWKTNSLSDYGESSMEEEMKASGYDLQYKIYSLALRQWLGDKRLAGYAYVFVRGIEDEGKGVYRRDLESNWENAFRDDLAKKTGIKRQEG